MSSFNENRNLNNQKLTELLIKLSKENPSLRFSQLLLVFGFVENTDSSESKHWKDEFYTEPEVVLERVLEKIRGNTQI